MIDILAYFGSYLFVNPKRRAYGIVDGIHLFQRISLDLERSNLANHGR